MALALVTAPNGEPVTLAEAKDYLRVDGAADDALITSLITVARRRLDGRDGWLGRALITQTWDLVLDRFPCGRDVLKLPLPPLQSVTSISYLDTSGATQVWSPAEYEVHTKNDRGGFIVPAYGLVYPPTRLMPEAVTIRLVAGYGLAAAVPEEIKAGIKGFIAHLFAHREPVITGTIATDIPDHIDAILGPYRIWTF